MSVSEMPPRAYSKILTAACLCALAAIALMVWSLLDPRPLQVIMAMSVGQALGTASFAGFLFVVVADLRRTRRALATKRANESLGK
jgi:uncharacterized membrane protein YgdD (TMEM256/DUF423 family)